MSALLISNFVAVGNILPVWELFLVYKTSYWYNLNQKGNSSPYGGVNQTLLKMSAKNTGHWSYLAALYQRPCRFVDCRLSDEWLTLWSMGISQRSNPTSPQFHSWASQTMGFFPINNLVCLIERICIWIRLSRLICDCGALDFPCDCFLMHRFNGSR